MPRSLELAQRHRMLQQDNDDFNFRQPVDPLTGDDDYSDGGGPGFRWVDPMGSGQTQVHAHTMVCCGAEQYISKLGDAR